MKKKNCPIGLLEFKFSNTMKLEALLTPFQIVTVNFFSFAKTTKFQKKKKNKKFSQRNHIFFNSISRRRNNNYIQLPLKLSRIN